MSDKTGIEWTQSDDGTPGATWNPVTGCTKVSPGCDHCYAETFAERWRGTPGHHFENGFDVTLRPERLDQPSRWKRPRRIFVNSMSDLFHKDVPDEHIARVWQVMASTPRHTYLILTKRHARMRVWVNRCAVSPGGWITHDGTDPAGAYDGTGVIVGYPEPAYRRPESGTGPRGGKPRHKPQPPAYGWPLPNVHIGTSIELDRYCRRADDLRQTPAAIRFLSLEPLLGPLPSLDLTGIDWAIIGGESGGGARAMDLGWARDLISRCREAGTVPFVKQLGSVLGRELGAGSKGGDMDRWPEDLKVREFPRVPGAVAA
jgi:protein gp37